MEVLQHCRVFLETLFDGWVPSLWMGVLLFVAFFIFAAWWMTFLSAFLKIKKPSLYGAMTALGVSLLAAVLLAGLVQVYLPETARSLEARELFWLCVLASSFSFTVPLMQCFWHTGYLRSLGALAATSASILIAVLVLNISFSPGTAMKARPLLPVLLDL